MKMLSVALFYVFFSISLFAQRPLNVVNRSQPTDMYLGQNKYCLVTVSVPNNLNPLFYESGQNKLPEKTDSTGTEINYHIRFEISKGYEPKEISIHVNGFDHLILEFAQRLRANQHLKYFVFDPDSTIVDCYNQLAREGMSLFRSGFYNEARGKYESVKLCSNIPIENDVDNQIARIDSILMWMTFGEVAYSTSNFLEAIRQYQKIFTKNPDDKFTEKRLHECLVYQTERCRVNFETAEKYFDDRDYVNAESLYKKVIELQCANGQYAIQRIREIYNLKLLSKVLTYELAKDVPIGLSYGKYKYNKPGGYITLRLNKEVFEAARSNLDSVDRPELNMSFGWTIKIVKPVWIFFGPGYTGVGKYVEDKTDPVKNEENLKLNISHALSPEIGIVCKIPLAEKIGITLRYTFQYRFAMNKAEIDYIGKTRQVFGAGLCF
jgi:tetratricopeptide (TPR) repeat protein